MQGIVTGILILWDVKAKSKGNGKIEKERPLKDEIVQMQGMEEVVVILVAVGVL